MKILVTGGSGFVGRNLVPLLQSRGHEVRSPDVMVLDLLDERLVDAYLRSYTPDVVVHLAANCGGIQYNQAKPADLWYENTIMGANVLDVSACRQVERVVMMATTCGYPRTPKTIPFVEEELWDGLPEPTNAPYGIAKRSLAYAGLAYRQQYGLDVRTLIPTNLYGPNDHFFDPLKSHVIPGLMNRMHEAKKLPTPHLEIWGTGRATRDFLYVEDACEAIALAVEKEQWTANGPVNLGSGNEVSIAELVTTLAQVTGFQGSISWDPSKPDGQPRRCLDISKAMEHLSWCAKTSLRTGLEETYKDYLHEVNG